MFVIKNITTVTKINTNDIKKLEHHSSQEKEESTSKSNYLPLIKAWVKLCPICGNILRFEWTRSCYVCYRSYYDRN